MLLAAAALDDEEMLALYDEIFPDEPLGPGEPWEDDLNRREQAEERVTEYLHELSYDPEAIPDIWPSIFPLRQPVEYDPDDDRILFEEVVPAGRG